MGLHPGRRSLRIAERTAQVVENSPTSQNTRCDNCSAGNAPGHNPGGRSENAHHQTETRPRFPAGEVFAVDATRVVN